jgi:hypothetical protein
MIELDRPRRSWWQEGGVAIQLKRKDVRESKIQHSSTIYFDEGEGCGMAPFPQYPLFLHMESRQGLDNVTVTSLALRIRAREE